MYITENIEHKMKKEIKKMELQAKKKNMLNDCQVNGVFRSHYCRNLVMVIFRI